MEGAAGSVVERPRAEPSYGRPCFSRGTPSSGELPIPEYLRPDTSEQKLPVFVYIHAAATLTAPAKARGIRWRTTTRRRGYVQLPIGADGWFLHPALLTGDPKNDSGDFGTLDQIKALEWVQKNIDKFGGDRANVTLVGASAGAQNVTYLMHSPSRKTYSKKAIIESKLPGHSTRERGLQVLKTGSLHLLVADGIAPNAKAAKIHVGCT